MEKEKNINGYDTLLDTIQKIEDFGDNNNLQLKKDFFSISENKSYNTQIRDFATELMLYCEDDELSQFQMDSKEKILKKIVTTLKLKS